MNGYNLKEAGQAYSANIADEPTASMAQMIRDMAEALRQLSGEVVGLSDQMHGSPGIDAGAGGKIIDWISDLRETSDFAINRARHANQELLRIRATIGI